MQRWVVVADSPFLPATGGGEREHLGFVRAVHRAGWLASLVVPSVEPLDADAYRAELGDVPVLRARRRTSPLRLLHPAYPYVVASRPVPRQLCRQVRQASGEVTGLVVFSYKSRLVGEALARCLDVPAVLRQHNREGDYHRSLAAGLTGPRRWVMRWEASRVTRDEARVDRASWLRAIADISLADADARRAAGAQNVVFVPPFAHDATLAQLPLARPEDAVGERVLFLGALDVATNTSALTWFLSEVWPSVLARAPRATLDVVGRGPAADLVQRLRHTPSTTLHADVDSVLPFLRRATVAVNPAVTGSGVNIKLIDYLQAGVPVVSTSLASAGLPLRPGEDLEVADDPGAFAARVVGLLEDRQRRSDLARQGRLHVTELLDHRRNLARIAEALAGPG